jgi:VanZ family protein
MNGSFRSNRAKYGAGLAIYLVYLAAITLTPFTFQSTPRPFSWQLLIPSRYDLAANLVLFMPMGGFLRALRSPGPYSQWCTLLAAGAVSLAIEVTQSFTIQRHPSLSDILLNILGGGIGFHVAGVFRKHGIRLLRHPWGIATAGMAGTAGLMCYAGLLWFVAAYPKTPFLHRFQPLRTVFAWLLRTVDLRPHHPMQQGIIVFLLCWPLGVALALSIRPASWTRCLPLVVGAWLFLLWIQRVRSTAVSSFPFINGVPQVITPTSLLLGLLFGMYLMSPEKRCCEQPAMCKASG